MKKPQDVRNRFEKLSSIEGVKVRLEKVKREHADTLHDLISNREVSKSLTIEISSYKDFLDYLRYLHSQWELNRDFSYAIINKSTEEPIGQVSLYNLNFLHNRAEIGLWIGNQFWNKGYGNDTLNTLVDYAFKQLSMNRLQAHIFTTNARSIHLFEKLNFQREGVQRQFVKKNGKYVDVFSYALLRNEYELEAQSN